MKIAILTSGVLPVPAVQGGAVENLVDFCLEYNDKHRLHDITVYSIHHPAVRQHPALRSEANHYHYIDVNSFFAKIKKTFYKHNWEKDLYYNDSVEYFLFQAARHIRRQDYDVIIIENRPGYVLKLKDMGTPLVIHQGNDYINSEKPKSREIYDAASCIINTSDYITKRVRTVAGDATKCKTVLNGIDTKRFFDAPPLPREQAGLSEKDFVIVYSGRLTKDKGIMELVQAISQLSDIPNLKLLIIGASFYGTGQTPSRFVQELKTAAEQIRDKVVFTGFVDYATIPSYLKMADIAVVPSMWEEPFGLTVVEAMAAGLPLITTRSGGIPEICEGVATIVERDDIVSNLTNAILHLYQHPEQRETMAQAAIERSKQFDKTTYARHFFEAICL